MQNQGNIWSRFLRTLASWADDWQPKVATPAFLEDVRIVVDAADLRDLKLGALSKAVGAANAAVPLVDDCDSFIVEDALVRAGPIADGTTANTSTLWIGGPDLAYDGAHVQHGFPLAPGERLTLPRTDLRQVYVLSATDTDYARVSYHVPQ